MIFQGNSMFLWQLSAGMNEENQETALQQLAGQLTDLKLNTLFVKVADGAVPYNLQRQAEGQWDDSALFALMQSMAAGGKPKIGWQYLYGREPEREAERALERIERLGLQGYILDAEQEYKRAGASAAEKFMKRLRAGSNIPLALCSYRFPTLHKEFPWQAFLAWMDAAKGDCHMPQVYWVGDSRENGPVLQLERCRKELQALKDLPLLPIGGLYTQTVNNVLWQPTVKQINAFTQTARSLACPGLGWWSWDAVCKLDGQPDAAGQLGWWAAIRQAAENWVTGDSGTDSTSVETRLTALETQARLHGWAV
jgi:hypothetical protein